PELQELSRRFMGRGGFDAWLRAMEENGTSVNVGSFVGATTIRVYGMGQAMGAPRPAELDSMRKAVRWAMEEGAFGVASALIYPPGSYATTEELIEIARAMAPYGGVYITHMRSEADQWLEAIDDALRIGREGGVPVEIYHLKAAGRSNWEKTALAIAKIDSARAAGLDVQANMYAYTAGGTGLSSCLPPWAAEDGRLYDNIRDPEIRTRIVVEVHSGGADWEDLCSLATPEGVLVLGREAPENRPWVGRRLSEIASEKGKDWVETIMDLLIAE